MGLKLAFIGSINDEILNKDELAAEFCAFLLKAISGGFWRSGTASREDRRLPSELSGARSPVARVLPA